MGKKVLDRRIQRTRRLLQNALLELILEKGYDEVTVQNVIDRADVGRSTFYAHFRDMEELLLSQFEDMREQFDRLLRSMPDENPWNLPLLMFQHAQGHHELYKALVGKKSGNIVMNHLNGYLSARMREHLKMAMSDKGTATIPAEILAHYLVSSLMALMTWWLDHDLPYTAERMNGMFEQLTRFGAESIIRQA